MEQHIRGLEAAEVSAAMDLVWRVFSEFEAPEYCAEGVDEFRRFIRVDNIVEKMHTGGMVLWGWYDGGTLAGVIAVTVTGHINLLFVDPAYQRRGIAKALHETAMDCFRARGVASVTVNSSPYAVEIYRRLGFAPVTEEQTVNGIRFTPMVLPLREQLPD